MVSTMVIGPGSVNLSLRWYARAPPGLARVHAALQAQFAHQRRAHRPIAVVADADLDRRSKSMPSTHSRKPCTKCWRDCSPSVTMSMPQSSCSLSANTVASRLAGVELGARETPWCPQRVRLGEPRGLRQAAGDRRGEHLRSSFAGASVRPASSRRANRSARSAAHSQGARARACAETAAAPPGDRRRHCGGPRAGRAPCALRRAS